MRGADRLARIRSGLGSAVMVAVLCGGGAGRPEPGDDRTFRPTVLIRKGNSQGSGTVIASVDGETLILTAAHVLEEPGPIRVELHRYNLGLEQDATNGPWPRRVRGEVAATDSAADVAIVRIPRMVALPYVARVASGKTDPDEGTLVTSIGIDLGTSLSSWSTQIVEVDRFEVEGSGVGRRFLITSKAPNHGRSGGGLFLESGDLVGVCVGRTEVVKGRWLGIFASTTSIRRLLRDLDRQAAADTAPAARRSTPITNTQARSPRSMTAPARSPGHSIAGGLGR